MLSILEYQNLYKECIARLENAIALEKNRQEKEMIADGGLRFITLPILDIQVVRYDKPKISFVQEMVLDSIGRDLDLMVLREEISQQEADEILQNMGFWRQ